MTLEQLQTDTKDLLFKCISGSRAQQLHSPTSDTDIKGIFVLPARELYGLTYIPQIANATNDEVYYEIGRFIDLLTKNNPNIIELVSTPDDCILFRHPLMDEINPEHFLSKLCKDTFAGYAASQIKKAKGLNKKIHRPVESKRKSILDFCYVIQGNGSMPLRKWLDSNNYQQEDCGLTQLDHFRDVYLLFHQHQIKDGSFLKGIASGDTANDVQLSSIPVAVPHLAVMNFNKDGYSVYCREYLEYWEWVEKRNDTRYQNTMSHGKNYDAKNMMHTFRLLSMAAEIATEHQVHVQRKDRDLLLQIKRGEFEYEDLLKMVNEKMEKMDDLYAKSGLPDTPDIQMAEQVLVNIRAKFYKHYL
ncbi:DNA polymerase beta superfamily protein [Chitinophaga rhizophila]|uniref:Nucleotidyltransferase domain-containing protein n=1 Tax=Chitinophaga rhizophila TaxID=2866212 RepID=A0ABS7GF57_9BACT|nr:nucleotidyltransferase domain-containing protein [Chitinophaga rhizophila]MBW8685936.1 nucleotidyltransferase domain-containing protein [Chitinophaga rhizophila]